LTRKREARHLLHLRNRPQGQLRMVDKNSHAPREI
jgi:hypothetical protein